MNKRIVSMIRKLSKTEQEISLTELAEEFQISQRTVRNDLNAINDLLTEQGLANLKLGRGGKVLRESDFAEILESLDEKDFYDYKLSKEERNALPGKILYEQEHAHECFLSDSSFRKIQFLSELLTFGRYMKQKHSDPDSVKIQMLTRQFIEKISQTTEILLTQDYDFFENLSKHLESTFALAAPLNDRNPVIDSVVEENPRILEAVQKNLPMIENYAGRKLTEAETGYIVVHLCAAIERKKNQEISFRVIVACHAGIGTSQLLLERLKKHFNFRITDIVSSHEAGNLKAGQADFVISTVPLKHCEIENIVVSPLLRDEDYIEIGNKVDQLRAREVFTDTPETEAKTPETLLNEIGTILYDRVPDEASALMTEIGQKVADFFRTDPVVAEGYSPALSQLLPASHIQLDIECENWQQAVRKSARKLLELGYIEESYIDAMIHNIEENGPYIVLTKGFALPHEGIDKGVRITGLNLIRLSRPVNFNAEQYDPVEFVCCMSATDHKTHLKAIFNLVNMLKDPGFLQALRECQTAEEAAEIIRQYENRKQG